MRVMQIDEFLEQSDVGLDPRQFDWARIVREGRAARAAADGGAWRIGDLANLVERRYRSGALKRFAEEIGESVGTVRRFRWVSASYDQTARGRFPELSFSHFQAVAALTDRVVWLERATRGHWSVDRLSNTSRATTGTAEVSPHMALAKPMTSLAARLGKLTEASDRDLARAAREGLLDTVEELGRTLDQVKARLEEATAKRARGKARLAVAKR
jgi:hypothetical protein